VITMPRRSVTRFFIPMIDVLTLLFCMFLLMPIMRENESLSQEEGLSGTLTAEELKQELESRQRDLRELYQDQERARAALAELQNKKRDFLQQHLFVRVLDISPKDGTLSFLDPKQPGSVPLKIDNETAARKLIAEHKKEAGALELFYVFQRPYDPAIKLPLFPLDRQTQQYRAWFNDVAYGGYLTHDLASKGSAP
jgi:hypothetical protein